MYHRIPRFVAGMAALLFIVLGSVLIGASTASAQTDPFVTTGPDQLGERVNESEEATARLNQAVFGLLGLAAVITVGSVVFWRLSAPTTERVRNIKPAFHIEYKPTTTPADFHAPAPASIAVPTVADIRIESRPPVGAWASQGWGLEESA
ncbi:MAG: hypothetical protein ACKO5A_10060 [Actinomycetota bacterium]